MNNIALIGNPNCGKTTLFNLLTGTYQKVGNWSGVTTEEKVGKYRKDRSVNIIDLPGLYSLSVSSKDELAVLKYLKNTPPSAIINVVDGTNLERSLSLSIELAKLNIPMVLAVNMCDDLDKNGINLNLKNLEKTVGIKPVKISALKNKGIDELMQLALSIKTLPKLDIKLDSSEKRYDFINLNIDKIIEKKTTRSQKITTKLDDILMHKFFGFFILIFVMTLVYYLSIKIGGYFGEYLQTFFDNLSNIASRYFDSVGVYEWMKSLICDAVISGLGNVISFLPQILVLFSLMTLIEESGYASRIAFILDRIFYRFNLSGKSVIPLVLSCGCTVSGVMATRTVANENERKMSVFLCPFMPCSAKLAVFAFISSKLLNGSALLATLMYFISILSVALGGLILKRFKFFKSENEAFFLEIPTLRFPSLKDVLAVLREKCKDFLVKAGSIVFIVSVILWALKNIGFNGYCYGNEKDSFLYLLGNGLKYIFYPLGFGSWEASIAILSSFFAKEAIIESIGLLSANVDTLFLNEFSVYAFSVFILLSPPCVASISVAYKELKSKKLLALMLAFQFLSAYIVALVINLLGILIQYCLGLIFVIFFAIIISLGLVFATKYLKNSNCHTCKTCKNKGKCNR